MNKSNTTKVRVALNSKFRDSEVPHFVQKGVQVLTKLEGFKCWFYNGTYFWVEDGTKGWKQEDAHHDGAVSAMTYSVRPGGASRVTYGSSLHWDRHPTGKNNVVSSFAEAERMIAVHYADYNATPVDSRSKCLL